MRIDPTPPAHGGGRFPVKYYLTAMMFIIFDIEIVFLYPGRGFRPIAVFVFLAMMLFLFNLTVRTSMNGVAADWIGTSHGP